MNATRLRLVLIGIICALVLGIGGGVWWLQDLLVKEVLITDHAKIDAELSAQAIGKLEKLKIDLANKKEIVERAKQIAATSEQYRYQDQVINDLTIYANRNGFGINSFDFSQISTKNGSASSGKTAFMVSLASPLQYNNFLKFMRDVEQNITKIQITSITLSPNPKNPTEILNPTLNLEVYLKK